MIPRSWPGMFRVPSHTRAFQVSQFLVLSLLISTFSLSVSAQFYLDSALGNDANVGDASNPWETIDHACAQLVGAGSSTTLFLSGEFALSSNCVLNAVLDGQSASLRAKVEVNANLGITSDNAVNQVDLHLGASGSFSFGNNVHVSDSNITAEARNGPWFEAIGTLLRFTSCNFTTSVLADSFPASFEPVLSANGGHIILVGCVFQGIGSASNIGSAIEAKSFGQLKASETHFIGLPSGAIYAHSGSNASFDSCIFWENDMRGGYLSSDISSGSAFYGFEMGHLMIDSCDIVSNQGRTAISVDSAESVTIKESSFQRNVAPSDCSAFRLIDIAQVSVSKSIFENNTFGYRHWWTTCISVKPETPMRSSVLFSGSTWTENSGLGVANADLFDMTGYSLLFSGAVDATVHDLDFDGENPWFSSVGAFLGAAINVQPNVIGSAKWRGYVAVCGNITFETDMVMDGRLILSRLGECRQLNLVDLGGHQLTVQTPIDPTSSQRLPDVADNWLQTGNFLNGQLVINSLKTTVCCDVVLPETEVDSDTVRFTDVEVVATTTFAWGTSRTKFELLGSSVLNLEFGARLLQTRPKNESVDHEAVIEGHLVVKGGAHVYAAGLRVNGTFDLQSASRLILFPSNWRGIQHPLHLDGTSYLNGTILLSLELMSDEYEPNLLYQPSGFSSGLDYFEIVRVEGQDTITSLEGPNGLTFQVLVTPYAVLARPQFIKPMARISDSLDSLILDWPMPMPINDQSFGDCAFIFAGLTVNTWLTETSHPRCSWESDTRLVVRSSSLPAPNTFLSLNTSNLPNTNPTGGVYVFEPTTPTVPIAQLSVVTSPCGSAIVSGAASSGFGSFGAFYEWSVTCNPPGCPTDLELALAVNQATIELGSDLFVLGPAAPYTFHLIVRNEAGVASEMVSQEFFAPGSTLQVGIVGSTNRTQPLNADLVVQARFATPLECPIPQVSAWQWSGSLIDSLAGFYEPSTTSVLHIPSQTLIDANIQPGDYSLTVTAYSGALGSSYSLTTHFFKPAATLVSTSSSHFSGSEAIPLTVLCTPELGTTPDLRFEWTLLECAEEFAESSYRPVVSLNETIALPKKCRGRTSTFDIRTTTYEPEYLVKSEELLDGRYSIQVDAFDYLPSTPVLLATTVFSFHYARDFPANAIVKVVVPPPSALKGGHKIPVRLEVITTFAGNLTGSAIKQHFSAISWQVNGMAVDATFNRRPFLTLPPSVVQNGKATILVSLLRNGVVYIGESMVYVGETPSGGSLTAVVEYSQIRLSTSGWSSHVPGSPNLRYQFMLRSNLTGEDLILSDLIDESTILTSAFSNDHIAVVRAFDVLDRFSEVTQSLPIARGAKRQSHTLADALLSLDSAVNISDWRLGNDAIVGILLAQDPTGLYDVMTSSAANLASSLPNTSFSSAAVLEQFALLQTSGSSELSASRTNTVLSTLSSIISAQHSRFGSTSEASDSSSRAFFRIMESVLPSLTPDGSSSNSTLIGLDELSGELPHTLISRHADQVLSSTYPEEIVQYSGSGLALFASRVGVFSSTEVTVSNALSSVPVTLSFTPNDWASTASNGYIGFYHTVYNGTFPIATPSALFSVVAETKFSNKGANGTLLDSSLVTTKSLDPETGTPGSYKTTFETDVELLQSEGNPSCVSNSGGGWQPACSTSVSGNTVTCSCNSPATLTLAFGLNDPSAPGGKSKLSTAAAAAIGVVVAVLLIVIIVILIVLFVPGAKDAIRPFRKRKYERAGP